MNEELKLAIQELKDASANYELANEYNEKVLYHKMIAAEAMVNMLIKLNKGEREFDNCRRSG